MKDNNEKLAKSKKAFKTVLIIELIYIITDLIISLMFSSNNSELTSYIILGIIAIVLFGLGFFMSEKKPIVASIFGLIIGFYFSQGGIADIILGISIIYITLSYLKHYKENLEENESNKKIHRIIKSVFIITAVIAILCMVNGIKNIFVVTDVINKEKLGILEINATHLADSYKSINDDNLFNEETTGLTTTEISTLLMGGKIKLNENIGNKTYMSITTSEYDLNQSFIYYDVNNKEFIVCLVANENGKYYVEAAKGNTNTGINGINLDSNDVWTCSNGYNSWK